MMTVDEMITVLQAYKAGKTIQFKPHVKSEWTTIDGEPSWLFPFCDYRVFKEDVPDGLIEFEHLGENGIKAGDIVAVTSSLGGNEITEYCLLRSGLPDKFNTALCCGILPNEDLYLAQLGFAWKGAVRQKFRKATEEECKKFIDACIKKNRMKKIIEKDKDYLFGCVSVSYRYQPYGESDPVHELMAEDEELYESVDDYMKSTCRGYMFTVAGNNGLVKDARVTKYIRYVHELQHILRVCGLDKLANNFKI